MLLRKSRQTQNIALNHEHEFVVRSRVVRNHQIPMIHVIHLHILQGCLTSSAANLKNMGSS